MKTKSNRENKIITFRYGYKETIAVLAVGIAIFGALLAISIIFKLWGAIALTVVFAMILTVGLFTDGALYPIYICSGHIGFRGRKMLWKDVRITVCVRANKYEMVIGTTYIRDKKRFKIQKKVLPCINLKNEKLLNAIMPYCKAKFLVVDANGMEISPTVAKFKKINEAINNFNLSFVK